MFSRAGGVRQTGYSLIELLVVLVIMGLLVGLLRPVSFWTDPAFLLHHLRILRLATKHICYVCHSSSLLCVFFGPNTLRLLWRTATCLPYKPNLLLLRKYALTGAPDQHERVKRNLSFVFTYPTELCQSTEL